MACRGKRSLKLKRCNFQPSTLQHSVSPFAAAFMAPGVHDQKQEDKAA
jgi:hypothetical protein